MRGFLRIPLNTMTLVALLLAIAISALAALSYHRGPQWSYPTEGSGEGSGNRTEWKAGIVKGTLLFTRQTSAPGGQPTEATLTGTDYDPAYRTAPSPLEENFGWKWRGAGFGYGVIEYAGTSRWDTVAVPAWPLAAALALPRAVALVRRRPGRTPGRCPACGYDLRATPDRCPECGTIPVR